MNPAHAVLDVMARRTVGRFWSEVEIARAAGLGQETVHRHLGRLRDLELVRWRSDRPRSGWHLTELGIRFHGVLDAVRVAA